MFEEEIQTNESDEGKQKTILSNPLFEMLIKNGAFLNQNITIYPNDVTYPDNLINVVKFLFGEGACVKQDVINNKPLLVIKGATFILRNARTLKPVFVCKEIKE